MKRNQEDDLTTQSRDAELDHTAEPAEPTSGERGTDPHSALERITLQETDAHRVSPFQESDEQAHHHRDPWSPMTKINLTSKSTLRLLASVCQARSLYYAVDSSVCTLWAIPINRRREEGSTFFLALSPETVRRWKGAPLALDEIKRLPGIPEPAQLALLGLTEQQPIQLQHSRNGEKGFN